MFRRLDQFLLDRVFQPVVNATTANCFAMSRSCATGCAVFLIMRLLLELSQGKWTVIMFAFSLLALFAITIVVVAIGSMEQRVTERSGNPWRENWYALRVVALLFVTLISIPSALGPAFSLRDCLLLAENLLWFATLYFGSCQRLPPARQWRLAEASTR